LLLFIPDSRERVDFGVVLCELSVAVGFFQSFGTDATNSIEKARLI